VIPNNTSSKSGVRGEFHAEEFEEHRRYDAAHAGERPMTPHATVAVAGKDTGATAGMGDPAAGVIVYLAPQERHFLHDLLETKITALRHEIHHTDARAMRTVLRAELYVALSLVERIGGDSAACERSDEGLTARNAAGGPMD
jgi:hypothetical protein